MQPKLTGLKTLFQFVLDCMKKFVKIDATTFLMLGGGGGLERYVMRWGALEGLSWYGIHGLHGLSCPVMLGIAMSWHAWNTCRGLVMSWHDMACIEYMSGACHVRAWHGMHGIHVGGLSCHDMHGIHVWGLSC